jgi:hypothetical protein
MGHSSLLRLGISVRGDISAHKIENTQIYGQPDRFRYHVKRRHTGLHARARALHDRAEKQELERLELFFAQDERVTGILSTPDDITEQQKSALENLNGEECDSEEVAAAVENGQKSSVGSEYSRVPKVLAEAKQTVENARKHISTVYEFQGEYAGQVYSSVRQGARKFLQQVQKVTAIDLHPARPNRTEQKREVGLKSPSKFMMTYDNIVAEVGKMKDLMKERLSRKNNSVGNLSQTPVADKEGGDEADSLRRVNTMMKNAIDSVKDIRVQEALPRINQYSTENCLV